MPRFTKTLTLLFVFLLAAAGWACSVPVFRYALEQWPPDAYEAVVFHRGALTAEQQSLVDRLNTAAANVRTVTVDLEDDPPAEWNELWEQQQTTALPWLALRLPARQRRDPPTRSAGLGGAGAALWSGPLDESTGAAMLDSPIRQEIGERIVKGASVVWVFLDGGEPGRDDAAYALLTRELARLQSELELPPIDPVDAASLSVAPEEVKLSFSAVRLSRDDPQEEVLLEMLLSVEPDLRNEEYLHEPMVFPVFGRGRALYALIGDGVTGTNIEEAGRFLTGACQCTVKAENPGVDLLLSVDWDRYVQPREPVEAALPPLAGLSGFTPVDATAAPADDAIADSPPSREPAANPSASQTADSVETQPAAVPAAESTISPAAATSGGDGTSSVVKNALLVLGVLAAVVALCTMFWFPRQS